MTKNLSFSPLAAIRFTDMYECTCQSLGDLIKIKATLPVCLCTCVVNGCNDFVVEVKDFLSLSRDCKTTP